MSAVRHSGRALWQCMRVMRALPTSNGGTCVPRGRWTCVCHRVCIDLCNANRCSMQATWESEWLPGQGSESVDPQRFTPGDVKGCRVGTNVMTSKYASSRVLSMLDWCSDWSRAANAQLPLPRCAQVTSTPAGRAERAVEAQPWSRRALTWPSTAPHSIARWKAVCPQVANVTCAPRCMTRKRLG
jgi:hypothetical protein